jgi:hypothetical protein
MVEPKISLTLLVPGAGMLSSQVCEQNPKESYDEHKLLLTDYKGKKLIKEVVTFKTRKQKLVSQNINICEEAYNYMLETPTDAKLARVWSNLSKNERLRHHFDLIASDFRAKSYSYEILDN